MVFVFVFLAHFTQYESLVPSMLLQMAFCHSFFMAADGRGREWERSGAWGYQIQLGIDLQGDPAE